MTKHTNALLVAVITVLLLGGCGPVDEKQTSHAIVYGVAALFALALLLCFCLTVKKKNAWILVLFSAVSIVNVGYFALSLSITVEEALLANRISYLGSVFLPLTILMAILDLCHFKHKKGLSIFLIIVGIFMFLITASPGYLEIYYRSASLEVIDGVTVLVKEYGPLHSLFLFYLVFYWIAIISFTVTAIVKKRIKSHIQVFVLTVVVSINLLVWFVEQLVHINFEFLSFSYIISEIFLLVFIHLQNEYERLHLTIADLSASTAKDSLENNVEKPAESTIQYSQLNDRLKLLTPTERLIYNCYLEGKTTAEILSQLNIKENTLKYHNKNLYSKLGVSSRKELIKIANKL